MANLQRRLVTDAVLTYLEATNKPIGDGIAPQGGGWQGEPNSDATNFVPYVVLTPMNVTASQGSLFDAQEDWVLPYALTVFGISRSQCEWMADAARDAMFAMLHQQVPMGSSSRTVNHLRIGQIGQVNRVTDVEPAYYGQTDLVEVWITR